MKILALYFFVIGNEHLQPVQPEPICEFKAKDINNAKEIVTDICQKHEVMAQWGILDPTSEWEDAPFEDDDVDDALFARRIFRFNTQYPAPRHRKAIIELRVHLSQS